MVLDTVMIFTYVIAIAVTAAVTGVSIYAYNKNKEALLNKVYSTINTLYTSYSGQIEAADPVLAGECKTALTTHAESTALHKTADDNTKLEALPLIASGMRVKF